MGLFTALLLAAAPALTPSVESKPVVPVAKPAETSEPRTMIHTQL